MDWFLKPALIFAFFTGFGWQYAAMVSDHQAEIKTAMIRFGSHWRVPAAIQKTNDFSLLSGIDLQQASRRRLLEDVQVVNEEGRVGLELGHFVVKGPQGDKLFACEYYDRVQLTFIAQDMAVNGEIPQLTVEGQCGISLDINRMQPIWLPVMSLKEMGPRNLRGYFFEGEKVFVSIFNIGTVWPAAWELQAVRMFNQAKTGREIAVDSSVEKSFRHSPVTISF